MKLHSHDTWHLPLRDLASATVRELPTLVERSSASSASSTCKAGDNTGTCQKPATAGDTQSIIIGVVVAVPVFCAAVVLFILHRRVKRKQRIEDAQDKYKSLDFGMGAVPKGGVHGGKMVPEMTVTDVEKSTRDIRGLSMDMNSPYLLPAAVNSSGSSIHSMSRVMHDNADPYRPVTFIRSDSDSALSTSKLQPSNVSTYTGSSDLSDDGPKAGLITNASRMSTSNPFMDQSPDSTHSPEYPAPAAAATREPAPAPAPAPAQHTSPPPAPPARLNNAPGNSFAASAAPRAKPAPPTLSLPEPEEEDPFNVTPPSPPEHDSPPALPQHAMPPSPPAHRGPPRRLSVDGPANGGLEAASADNRRVSVMGLRPLPPDDPHDNPEQRANRIRSFYKEYFDDSKPNPAGKYPPPPPLPRQQRHQQQQQQHQYQNSYEADIHADYSDYADFMHEAPRAPFAEPMARRAMTPPPRIGAMDGGRARSNTSFGSVDNMGSPAFRPPPKKNLPPPIALHALPTPHALTDDMSFTPVNFAPPVTYRDRQAGRAESPRLPYSPSVRAHTPLATSFDDLNVLPSAHALRKSSTFTSLDFAPPPRFRNEGTASDAGSIRSNNSGISTMQQNAIRAGAYRVSRLPTDMVGTQDDLAQTLKPSWGLRG